MKRTYTIEEANALVPRVAATFARTTQLLGRARLIARRLAAGGIAPEQPGGLPDEESVAHDAELAAERNRAKLLIDAAREEARSLEALGILVRDLERGLIDFRSVMDGEREVFLCWRLGEREILFWHDAHSGYVGRQPVAGHRFFRSRQLRPPPE